MRTHIILIALLGDFAMSGDLETASTRLEFRLEDWVQAATAGDIDQTGVF